MKLFIAACLLAVSLAQTDGDEVVITIDGDGVDCDGTSESELFAIEGDHCVPHCDCVTSLNYPEAYGNRESCTIRINADVYVTTGDLWSIEDDRYYSDELQLNGGLVMDESGDVPMMLNVGDVITWDTNGWYTEEGWALCFSTEPPPVCTVEDGILDGNTLSPEYPCMCGTSFCQEGYGCNLERNSCVLPYWQASEFGPCSATCGAGTQTRQTFCNTGNDNDCFSRRPSESQTCNIQECRTCSSNSDCNQRGQYCDLSDEGQCVWCSGDCLGNDNCREACEYGSYSRTKDACPRGTSKVTESADCAMASTYFGIPYNPIYNQDLSNGDRLCLLEDGYTRIGRDDGSDKFMCMDMYFKMQPGVAICDEGFVNVVEAVDCEYAASVLGYSYISNEDLNEFDSDFWCVFDGIETVRMDRKDAFMTLESDLIICRRPVWEFINNEDNACEIIQSRPNCVTDGPGAYGSDESCDFALNQPGILTATEFDTEPEYFFWDVYVGEEYNLKYCALDILSIDDGREYCGSYGPEEAWANSGTKIHWYGDNYQGYQGFTLCWEPVFESTGIYASYDTNYDNLPATFSVPLGYTTTSTSTQVAQSITAFGDSLINTIRAQFASDIADPFEKEWRMGCEIWSDSDGSPGEHIASSDLVEAWSLPFYPAHAGIDFFFGVVPITEGNTYWIIFEAADEFWPYNEHILMVGSDQNMIKGGKMAFKAAGEEWDVRDSGKDLFLEFDYESRFPRDSN